jgi:hypothetical protein
MLGPRSRGLDTRYVHDCKGTPTPSSVKTNPEMEFVDINLTKDPSLLLHAVHSLFTDFNREMRKLESIHECTL